MSSVMLREMIAEGRRVGKRIELREPAKGAEGKGS
jgi:hypothetical protein